MLARHPKTGKEIRILKTDTRLWKDKKTLFHCTDTCVDTPYKRWNTICSSVDTAKAWSPDYTLFLQPSEELSRWFPVNAQKTRGLHFLSADVYAALGGNALRESGFQTILCLDDLLDMYPYLNFTYRHGETTLDECLAAIARLLRCRLAATEEQPAPLWFLTSFYKPPQNKRFREIKHCLQKNLENPLIDRLVLFIEPSAKEFVPKNDKIMLVELAEGARLTYKNVLDYIASEAVPASALVAFANSDIYIDDSWKSLWHMSLENRFLALLRYEETTGDLFGPRADSQDTWVVSADSVKARNSAAWAATDFPFGKGGCDNAIALHMLRQKFLCSNPCMSLKTYHVHDSAVRTYDPKDIVDVPMLLYLEPSALNDLEIKTQIGTYAESWPTDTCYSRTLFGDAKDLPVFCSMVARDKEGPYEFDVGSSNIWQPPKESLYTFSNAFMTPSGLVYTEQSLMLGKNAFLEEACSKEYISNITPAFSSEALLAVPLRQGTSQGVSESAFAVEYLSKILRLREAGYKGEFWLPTTDAFSETLQQFKWGEREVPVLPYSHDVVAFGSRVNMLVPTDTYKDFVPRKEDIMALRKASRHFVADAVEETAVLVGFEGSGSGLAADKKILETTLKAAGYSVVSIGSGWSAARRYDALSGTALVVSVQGPQDITNDMWCLPTGAVVLDIQTDVMIRGKTAQMAGACDVTYHVALRPRGVGADWLRGVVGRVLGALKASETAVAPPTDKPTLFMPRGFKGFHAHTGDSFREMAAIWAERGYVVLSETTSTPFCWLDGIGNTLLYDRPTWEWLDSVEPTYRKLLAGNPAPDSSHSSACVSWSFWPRRPRLVEALVDKGVAARTWSERSKTLVFYGRVENAVQSKRRPDGLLEACDDVDMPRSIGKETPYTYSQEEYLRRLADARFGLCMAGYGSKCHREVECMAMGCVPVVAPNVDMEHYAVPPIEGVHYIRLKTYDAQEVKERLLGIQEDEWARMSRAAHEWWVANASAEGFWNITKSLAS